MCGISLDMSVKDRIPLFLGMIFIVLHHTQGTTDISSSFAHLGYGKVCEAVYGNSCLNALHLTIRKFYLGKDYKYTCIFCHTALFTVLLLLPLDQQIFIYNGILGRVASPINFSCFFQMFFFSRNWILLVPVRAYETKVSEMKLLWTFPHTI